MGELVTLNFSGIGKRRLRQTLRRVFAFQTRWEPRLNTDDCENIKQALADYDTLLSEATGWTKISEERKGKTK